MSGIINQTGAKSGIVGTTVGTPAGGLSEADVWRNTSDMYLFREPISTWERADTYGAGTQLGTGMSESSGVFTFPSTGHWLVNYYLYVYFDGNTRYFELKMQYSSNSGSGWDVTSTAANFLGDSGQNSGNISGSCAGSQILNITNASTSRVRFDHTGENSSVNMKGSSTMNATYATFIKLG